MSKKSKSSPISIFIIVLVALCVISIIIDYWYIFLVIAVIGVALAIYIIQKRKKDKNITNNMSDSNSYVQKSISSSRKITVDMLKYKIDEDILKYKYDEKMYYTSDIIPDESLVGKDIVFVEEPENEYDSNAIAIYVEGNKLGYVYKGMIQDMLHDWFKKDYAYTSCISSVVDSNVRYIVGFYKPSHLFKGEIFKLTKTSKKIDEFTKRSDNIKMLTEGSCVSFEWDDDNENYIVYDDCYNEIGELPKKANSLIVELDNYVAVVDECDTSDDVVVKIAIFY